MTTLSYKRHRYPPFVIQHAVDVEELLVERGIDVTYETIRTWVAKFGPTIARRLRRLRPKAHPLWHLDEMYVSIGGRWMYLWRAVDQDGEVLEVLVQAKRDKRAAVKMIRRLLKKQGFAPRTVVTDRWRAYAAAFRDLGLTAWHHQAKWKNNRIESAHVPVRRRERKMQRFRSPGSAQRFLSIHAAVYNTFNAKRHEVSAANHRLLRGRAFDAWRVAASSAA
jgi:transposase-like protein